MTYAIIETGGKQLRVEAGRFYDIDLLQAEEGDQVSLDNVLLVQHEEEVHIGQPLVEGALVEGTVMRHLRGKKIIVYKMRPKKKTRKKRGHRQELTRLMIDSISINGKILGVVESQTSVTEVTPEASETVTETATEATEVQESVESQTSVTEVTSEASETVTETATEATEVQESVETISEQVSETTAEIENVSEEKPENQAE
ncbi:MAG: 50S ribosomal protein L21 [Okeania sp. SIO3B5]|nr:50S ribosomal protein L21 [Okeania sp. SIO3B5]